MGRHKGIQKNFYASPEMDEAVRLHTEETGQSWSDVIRQAVAAFIGRPDLAEPPPTGRPRKDAAPEVEAPRKKAVAATGKKVTAAKKSARKGAHP